MLQNTKISSFAVFIIVAGLLSTLFIQSSNFILGIRHIEDQNTAILLKLNQIGEGQAQQRSLEP